MREELRAVLLEVRGSRPAPGLLDADLPPAITRPPLAERARLWDLAIRLGRELGAEVDVTPPAPAKVSRGTSGPARGKGVDYG